MDLFRAGLNLANFPPDVRIIENKTHSKIKDIEYGPCKAKLEFIIIDFILRWGTLFLTEYKIMLEYYQQNIYKYTKVLSEFYHAS